MRRVIFAFVGTAAGLVGLLSFKTRQAPPPEIPAAVASGGTGPSGSPPVSSAPARSASPADAVRSVLGDPVQTGRFGPQSFGPVQVKVTVRGRQLLSVNAVVFPVKTDTDRLTNARAIPILNREAISAHGAHIDMVSMATYTSRAYIASLQSALDRAGLH